MCIFLYTQIKGDRVLYIYILYKPYIYGEIHAGVGAGCINYVDEMLIWCLHKKTSEKENEGKME